MATKNPRTRKIDPKLRSQLNAARDPHFRSMRPPANVARAKLPPPEAEASREVDMLVRFTGDVEDLRAIGFVATTVRRHPKGFWLAAGRLPLDRADELAAIEHVQEIEASRNLQPELNTSIGQIKVDRVHSASTSYKGRGVIVGVIDSGFDYRHRSLRKANGDTRVLGIWNQWLTVTGGETASTYGVGVVYTEAEINAALAAADPLSLVRIEAGEDCEHGTHVAGTAAGNGSIAGNCHGSFTYVGVAPEAELLLVHHRSGADPDIGSSMNFVNAIEWIFDHPRAAGKPVVINASLGDNLGSHDGQSLVEQFIDLFVLSDDGRAFVKSAGNEGNDQHHAMGTVTDSGGTSTVAIRVLADDDTTRYLDLWYPHAGRLDVRVEAPSGATSAWVAPDDPDLAWVVDTSLPVGSQTTVTIDSNLEGHGAGTDNRVFITIRTAGVAKHPAGTWKLHLRNNGADDVDFHAWLERGSDSPYFPTAGHTGASVQRSHTISIPGTAEYAITVGAANSVVDDMADFSSYGPTRDGRHKPEITAPGVAISAPAASVVKAIAGSCACACSCCCACCFDHYMDMQGTSMAAPHVAGVIALLFEKNPELDVMEIRDILAQSARAPSSPRLDEWGAGLVDAEAALALVPAPGGGAVASTGTTGTGGGTGSGVHASPPTEAPAAIEVAPLAAREAARESATADADLEARVRKPGPPHHSPWSVASVPVIARLRKQALATPAGRQMAALVSRHFSEVRGLINNNRRLATLWHRANGPWLLRHLFEEVTYDDRQRPPELSSADQRARLIRLLTMLREYASPALVHDLDRFGPVMVEALLLPLARVLSLEPAQLLASGHTHG